MRSIPFSELHFLFMFDEDTTFGKNGSILFILFYVLFNDALNTFLINCYIGVGNILIGKIRIGYLTGK